MGTRKELIEIKKQLAELKSFLHDDVDKARADLKDLKSNISNISLRVKKISPILLDNGEESIKIEYEAPTIILHFDYSGEPIYDPVFYSINALDLIPGEDFKKISIALHKISKKKKVF